MSAKDFKLGIDAQQKLYQALKDISTAVGSTMGPGGRPFGFDKLGTDYQLTPSFSKDGLTVLRALRFDDPAYHAVLGYAKQASAHSVLASGDGTTSTIILAEAIARTILEQRRPYPQLFARQMEEYAQKAIKAISEEAIRGDGVVRKVALTSTNGDEELTDIVLQAIKASSSFGSILTVKNPASAKRYSIDMQDGYSYCKGYEYNNTFALSASSQVAASKPIEWKDPLVAIFNGHLLLKEQVQPIIDAWVEACKKSASNLVILAYEVSDDVTNHLMVLNRRLVKAGVASFVIKPRISAEINSGLHIFRDIASFCGIKDSMILDGGNYKEMDDTFFGTCDTIKITSTDTMFLGRASNHYVEQRIQQNQSIAEEARSDFDRQITQIRNAELAEGLVKVEIGGGLLPDLQEREDRFDDASKAAQACMKNGALPGGGYSYIRAASLISSCPEFIEAVRSVYNQIMQNYGEDSRPSFVPDKSEGYKITESGIERGSAAELGVLDAADTVCAVLQNGVALGVKIATIGGYIFRKEGKEG